MTHAPTTSSYVTLALGEEVLAVEVGIVREILDSIPITRLPIAPPFLSGVIDVRGATVPVIDLRVKLGLPPVPATLDTRILIVNLTHEGRDLLIGLHVERVFEVAEFETEALQTVPDIGERWKSEYIKAIGRLREQFVIIVDPLKLFSSHQIDSIPGAS
jgi:purine-binding chemotaxis protein CheW